MDTGDDLNDLLAYLKKNPSNVRQDDFDMDMISADDGQHKFDDSFEHIPITDPSNLRSNGQGFSMEM